MNFCMDNHLGWVGKGVVVVVVGTSGGWGGRGLLNILNGGHFPR